MICEILFLQQTRDNPKINALYVIRGSVEGMLIVLFVGHTQTQNLWLKIANNSCLIIVC